MFPQNLGNRIGIELLCLRQQTIGLFKPSSCLLVHRLLGKAAGLSRSTR